MTGREIVKKLTSVGFIKVSQKGSHLKLKKEERLTIVPLHGAKDIPIGTIKNIEKQSGVKLL